MSCHDSLWGCCSDGITPSNGENFKGCKEIPKLTCQYSFFGCCADGITSATGPEGFDCPESEEGSGEIDEKNQCAVSLYGCCPDGIQSAWGLNFLGCSDFIPNLLTPIRAQPEVKDPLCKQTLFGCCSNGLTAASGPNFMGCKNNVEIEDTNTNFSHEGLITLNMTLLSTASPTVETTETAEITELTTFQTTSETFNCAENENGCCLDGLKSALGPNFEGCGEAISSCAATPFGCCLDGIRSSQGPGYLGCPIENRLRGTFCSKPNDTGPGRNFSVKWYFDLTLGGCRRFWYGGIGGNQNRFESEETCVKNCIEPAGPDLCFLPKVAGRCGG